MQYIRLVPTKNNPDLMRLTVLHEGDGARVNGLPIKGSTEHAATVLVGIHH